MTKSENKLELKKTVIKATYENSAGMNFSSFTGHMSSQIFLLVGNFTKWTRHNLLTDNT